MSPEQAEMSGLDVDTRSDIYSLGVLLYESLTGKTPFDATKLLQSGVDEMRKTLREREPQRPSTMVTTLQGEELLRTAKQRQAEPPKLISLLRGDLDWIVMKALEKDRSRRYETANGLAMDIQRYLRNEPVVARPPSRIYRFQKFVRRNKAACAATAAVAAALLIGFGASTRLFFIEREAKKLAVIAEQRAEKARATEFQLRQEAEARERIVKAAVLIGENHLADADKLMDGMPSTPSTLEGASVYRSLAEWHALRKDWQKAVERYAVLLKVNQFDGWDITTLDYLGYGPALIESNDLPGYERFRKNVIARFAGTANPVVAERVVKICLLLPPDQRFIAGLSPFVDVALKLFDESASEADADVFRLAWASVSLSLMEFRKGNYQQALEWGRRCLDFPEKNEVRSATAHLIRAMALFRLGETESARSELAQGRAVVNAKFAQPLDEGSREEGFWFDWMFAKIILREASGMIGPGAM
jgi:tetratricopeptide (TPR) repeat protein